MLTWSRISRAGNASIRRGAHTFGQGKSAPARNNFSITSARCPAQLPPIARTSALHAKHPFQLQIAPYSSCTGRPQILQQLRRQNHLLRQYSSRTVPSQNISPSTPTLPSPRNLFNKVRRRKAVQSRSKTSFNGTRSRSGAKGKPLEGKTAKAVAGGASQSKNVLDHLPNMQGFHRPTKEELLAAATGFWSRLRVRFKWFSIRSLRPFNMDDISAFFSWVLLGHLVWVIVGTTTFFSLLILAVNTVFAQGKYRPGSKPRSYD